MSHQLDDRIRDHARALDQAAPPIRLDDVGVSGGGDTGRRLARPLAAAAAVVVVVVGLVVISEVRDSEPEPAAVSQPLPNTTATPATATATTAAAAATELSESETLDEARIRWASAAVASYRLTVAEDRNYWSRGCEWTTVVSDGVVTEASIVPSSTRQECPQAEWTVEQLHDLVSSWLASIKEFPSAEFGDHTLQVEYNEVGVPVTMEYDLANADDEEASKRVVTFESLPPDAASVASEMSVDGALVVGAEFEVSFTGSLRESRGGYFWLQEADGTQVALLRSDGKLDIPMSYDLDLANASMLDDALSGDTSTLVLPPRIAPGQYRLCTANSAVEACIEVELLGG